MSYDFEPLRLGIAGTRFISGVHAACAMRSPFVELVAVASARDRASRERVGALDPAVELLTLDELFLEVSKHLLLEKPRRNDS
jgi:hypothetical protein